MADKIVFGAKPPTQKVTVRIQQMGDSGHAIKTQTITIWDHSMDTVTQLVTDTLRAAFEPAEPPVDYVAPTRRRRT
jgi:hypothetical protein